MARALDAAGITDPALRSGYEQCRRLNSRYGKSFYLATLLLPADRRPYVHALYGFARAADDLVDETPPADRARRFEAWARTVRGELEWGESSDPIRRALLDTLGRWQIPMAYIGQFLDSMHSDLTVTSYATFKDLEKYMWGSAAVIGLEMLPILGRLDETVGWEELEDAAINLGIAFQLTNFLRDVDEDLDRGRIYLPQDSLAQFGVDRERLTRRIIDEPIRNLIAHEVARTREFYALAIPGIRLVDPRSQDCLQTATTLYSGILDELERVDYDIFAGRATVGTARRARVAAVGLAGAIAARRRRLSDPTTPAGRGGPSSTTSARPARSRTADPRPEH